MPSNATLFKVNAMIQGEPRNAELPERLHQLTPAMAEHPDLIAVYLFGSQATGDRLPTSDVDIAYLLDSPDLDRELDVEVAITCILGTDDADVQLLNKAPLPFQYRVVSSGRVVYSRDEPERHRYEAEVRRAYEANKAKYEVSRQDLLQLLR